ncbi:prepilin-type N-terminal cleavage/methylation domain-containing protein [Gemmata sp. JC717]|uniref:prepilin-type N-terminal cleavage/methylation domain-containing protein n=1 Tax=Gemmata algarum TaxID=2975278 RepID=UPI0021BBA27B|nr:prepilin-type N-terminal cleavage/methylation domain-containing protein [Gemmata algarum]MDY3552019.1 prepilin-type N-terminal cleavage/methylation domain-containing protein [Gemmata algarum]
MITRSARRPRRRGLSLIEVLLALAILLLSIIAIGRLVDVGTDHGNAARASTRGSRLAQSKMAEVEAGVVALTGEASGAFDGDDAAWNYTVTPEAAGPPNLYTVTVKVSRTIDGKSFELVLTQMIFDPTMTGSAAQAERPAEPEPADTTTTGGTTP